MAELTLDLRHLPRRDAYAELATYVDTVLEGIDDPIAEMATISALVYHAFGWLWVGFYRMVDAGRLLRVGPYQGTLGCLEIAVGRGVCGTAARDARSIIVDDVEQFPGHIACDARSRSEIVLPVFDVNGSVIAIFDADADVTHAFREDDRVGLEQILSRFRRPR